MNFRSPRFSASLLRRWLTPGIGVKRWLLMVFVGELAVALGGAFWLNQVYHDVDASGPGQTVIYLITLQFLPRVLRAVVLGMIGLLFFVYGSLRLVRVLVAPFISGESDQPLVEVIYQKRYLARGPKIVAIGGGTGLSTLLRGLKEYSSNITAVVTVADDGGSSGRLREVLGIPAVGDIRNCIVALADAEPLMGQLLQYRFPVGAGDESSLGGHAVGNLLLAAMSSVQGGDFEEAVREMNRVLAVRGSVVPATALPVTLHAKLLDGEEVQGQSLIARQSAIDRVWLSPEDINSSEDALAAIAEADLIVMGPGSLYTSILPSLLLSDLAEAVRASSAVRLFVCNVATQKGETQGYDLADHVTAFERHTGPGLLDVALANNQFAARRPGDSYAAEPVRLRWPPAGSNPPRLVLDDVVDPENAHHHDPARLAASVLRVYEREVVSRRRSRGRETVRAVS